MAVPRAPVPLGSPGGNRRPARSGGGGEIEDITTATAGRLRDEELSGPSSSWELRSSSYLKEQMRKQFPEHGVLYGKAA